MFASEQRNIFGNSWICVARSEQLLRPGDFLQLNLANENIILVRNRDGDIRGVFNLCRHRGALLCDAPSGNVGRSIRCPYHGWTYDLDGKLVAAPYIDELSPAVRTDRDLHRVAVQQWLGYLWVNLDAAAASLEAQIEPLLLARFEGEDVISKYAVEDLRVAHSITYDVEANWKLIFENFCECYHCPTMHPELCAAVPQFRTGYGTVSGPTGQGAELAPNTTGFSLSGAPVAAPLPGLAAADERMFYGVLLWPTLSLNFAPDHVLVMRIVPRAPDRTTVLAEWLFHPDAIARPDFSPDDAVNLFDITNRQDFEVIELVQRGTASARFEQVYSPHEHLIAQFQQWVRKAMVADHD